MIPRIKSLEKQCHVTCHNNIYLPLCIYTRQTGITSNEFCIVNDTSNSHRIRVRNIHLSNRICQGAHSSCGARFVNIFTSKETRIRLNAHRRTHVRILLSVSSTFLFPSLFFSALCPTLCRLRKQQASSIAVPGTHTESNLPNLRFDICN